MPLGSESRARGLTRRAALALGSAAAVLGPACQVGGTAPKKSVSGTVDFLLWTLADPNEAEAQKQLVQIFQEKNPGIVVNAFDTAGANYWEKLNTLMASGSPPDVVSIYDLPLPPYADNGTVRPLDDYFKSDKLDRSQFYPNGLQALQWGGKQMGMPINMGTIINAYNLDMYDKVSLKYPPVNGDWTWTQFVEIAKRLTDPGARAWGTFFSTDVGRWFIYVYANGSQPFDRDDNPMKSNLLDPIVVQTAEEWFGLVTRYRVAPTPAILSADRTLHFRTGNYANVITAGPWTKGEWGLAKEKDLRWDVSPLPKGTKGPATIVYVNGIEITSEARNPDAAWELLKFHVSDEAQKMMGPINGRTPVIKRVAESDAYLGATPPKSTRVYLDTLAYARAVIRSPAFTDIRNRVNSVMNDVYREKTSAKEALQIAHQEAQKLLDEYHARKK